MADLSTLSVEAVPKAHEPRFRHLLEAHHYLGVAPTIGEPRWYVVRLEAAWVALVSFSAAALKCRARDQWLGWDLRDTYSRLPCLLNNTRFLVLRPIPNWGSRVLSLLDIQISQDWPQCYGHAVMLLETFVDQRFDGGVSRAAHGMEVGQTAGFRRKPRLTATQMKSLYAYFTAVVDPRVSQGKRHQFATILALAAAAELCGAVDLRTSISGSPRCRIGSK